MCACIFARNGKTTARVASNFQSVSFVLDFFAFAQGSRGNITSLEVSPAANSLPLRNSTLPGIGTLKSYISCVLRCCIVGELTECMEMHKHFTLRLQSSLNLRNAFHGRTMGALALTWKAKRDSVHCTVEPERITSSRNRAHIGPTRTILHNCEAPEIGRLQTACHRRGTKNPLNL